MIKDPKTEEVQEAIRELSDKYEELYRYFYQRCCELEQQIKYSKTHYEFEYSQSDKDYD